MEAYLQEEKSESSKHTVVCGTCHWGWNSKAKNNWAWLWFWSCFMSGLTPTSKKPSRWEMKLQDIFLWICFQNGSCSLLSGIFERHISRFVITICLLSRASNMHWRCTCTYKLLFFTSEISDNIAILWTSIPRKPGEWLLHIRNRRPVFQIK